MDFSNAVPSGNGKPTEGIEAFGTVDTAPEFAPVPHGIYSARVVWGESCNTKTSGADAYRMKFKITEGAQTGKTLVRTWTFSARALPYTQRELNPFGLTTSTQLLATFPPIGKEFFVRLVVAIQKGSDGIERNDIKKIDIVRVVETPAAAFQLDAADPASTPAASTPADPAPSRLDNNTKTNEGGNP